MSSMHDCVLDLEQAGKLRRIRAEVNPHLELAEIQRRAYLQNAPALLFENVKGTDFPCVANLFGTVERLEYIFRDTIDLVQKAIQLKANPQDFLRQAVREAWRKPSLYAKLPFCGLSSVPKNVSARRAPVMGLQTTMGKLPQIHCWPDDGGAFITLPQVFSQQPGQSSIMRSNLGMYRIQMGGNDYIQDREIGLHYQIHRGLGIHHTEAVARGEKLPVSIFVGGHPAHTLAAVMPLPEDLSELIFAGMLAGRRFRYTRAGHHLLSAEADFCITGWIDPTQTKPEGPFGDHLGYYSLTHDFPVMQVDQVFHRKNAIWPFTVVGRPPQEDTSFGAFIHKLTSPMVPVSLPGVKSLHAVDAAGVHPLLLAVGSERYVPYRKTRPQELLTQAHAILGFNQCSLAKYLFIIDGQEQHAPSADDIPEFLRFLLERVDLTRDLHFQTKTTIDTLDYSGDGLNEGSKLVIAVTGPAKRNLATDVPAGLTLPPTFGNARMAFPGVLLVQGPKFTTYSDETAVVAKLSETLTTTELSEHPLVIICDEPEFAATNLNNFLWTTFTRSNPSHDCHGVGSFTEFKHWGAKHALIIDARLKPHHAPPLVEDPQVSKRVDEMCKSGGPLHGILS